MPEFNGSKPGSKADPKTGATPDPNPSPKAGSNVSDPPRNTNASGRVIHDERGNAVWDWIVETGRIFVGNTSRLLRKLEAPELKIEETQPELRLECERDPGGGYDPYGRSSGTGMRSGSATGGSGVSKPSAGGGYDPYSKALPPKLRRKP